MFPDPETGYLGEGNEDAVSNRSEVATPIDNEANVQAMKDIRMELVTTLQSTDKGKKAYVRVCDKKIELYEFVSILSIVYYGNANIYIYTYIIL